MKSENSIIPITIIQNAIQLRFHNNNLHIQYCMQFSLWFPIICTKIWPASLRQMFTWNPISEEAFYIFPCSAVYSHAVLCIPKQCCIFPCSPLYSRPELCFPIQCCVFPCSVVYSHAAVLCIPMQCRVFLCNAVESASVCYHSRRLQLSIKVVLHNQCQMWPWGRILKTT